MGIIKPELFQASRQVGSTTYRGRLYLPAQGEEGLGVYSTDGETFALVPGTETRDGFSRPKFYEFKGDLFMSFDEGEGAELYRWDDESFSQFYEFAPGCSFDASVCYPNSGNPRGFVQLGDSLFLLANDDNDDQALYRIDLMTPPGDYNEDGVVNAADYTIWRNNLGSNVTRPGDMTPGTVTSVDYDVWTRSAACFGRSNRKCSKKGLLAGLNRCTKNSA